MHHGVSHERTFLAAQERTLIKTIFVYIMNISTLCLSDRSIQLCFFFLKFHSGTLCGDWEKFLNITKPILLLVLDQGGRPVFIYVKTWGIIYNPFMFGSISITWLRLRCYHLGIIDLRGCSRMATRRVDLNQAQRSSYRTWYNGSREDKKATQI